jgi:glycosyltransferase involved in cell wall biosynthesis
MPGKLNHIAIDIRKIHDSGIGTYISNLVPLVIQKMPETKFYLLGNVAKLSQIDWCRSLNIELIDISSQPFSPQEQFELVAKIPANTDLLWCTQINVPILYQKKMIVTVHDILHIAMPQLAGSWLGRTYIRLLLTAIKHKSSSIISVSNFTQDELVRLMDFNPDRIEVIYPGVANKWFRIIPEQNPHDRAFILFVGNLKPHKNISRLIEAFQLIQDKVDCDLVIVGTAKGLKTKDDLLLEKISTFGDRIKFTGYIDDERLAQYFAHAKALVFPSLYEGFGLPAVEAMACGCPVITSKIASLPEVCGDAVLYCDPYAPDDIADRILQMLTEPGVRETIIQAGRERSATIRYESTATKTVQLIKKILD